MCEVVVLDSGTNKRFYLHEVNPLKDIVAATQQDPYREGQQPQPARPVRSILVQRYFESNKRQTEGNKEGSKQDSEELYQSEVPNDPLITIHNIDEGNLNKALDLGGFAVPSLGITKQSTPYSDFGGISLIGTRDMVDPKNGTPVFSQDAYTQTFPQPVWDKSLNQEGASKLREELEAGDKEAGFDESRKFIYSTKTAPNKDALVKTLLTSKLGAYLFLKSKGIKVEPVAAKPVELTGVAGDTQVRQVAEDLLKTDPKLQNPESIKRLSDAFINYYKGRKGGLSQKILSRSLNDDGTVELTRLESILRSVKEAETQKGKAVDDVATGEAILKKANEYRDEFESWAQGKANEAFDAPKIEVKGKLKPVTLANVVEAMKSRVVSNQESTFVFGEGKVRASTTQKFGSIEEIQKNRDKVTDSGTVSAQNKAISEKFDKFRALTSKSYKGGESLDAFNSAMEALARVARKRGKLTEAKVRTELMKEFDADDATVKLGLEILNDLNNSLTDYFEAKPQRAVTLDEFRGAVVPEKTSDATIKRLEDAGLTVMRYGEQPGARTQAVQELTNKLNNEQGNVLYQNQSGPRGAYSPSQRLITLFQSSDPSTFIHESGHFFLDVMTDLANRPDAPQQLRQDMKILMSWFGVKSLDAWNAMTLDEKREYHEKFARGFERYMREGKAPSVRLMRIFHSFMNWLKGVYSSVRQLNVDLTPEVREVMDRMLATDKEIRTAKAVMGLANTYITRDQFPGTDEEWHEWEEKIKDEDDYARARLTAQVLGERAFLEKKTAEYQAKYADEDKARKDAYSLHYKEALDRHREEPIYKMRKRMLEDKEDGEPIYPIARADVDFLPKEQIEELDRLGILSDDGYPLDVLSRQFGYDNETAFITDLINVASAPIETVAKRDAENAVKAEFGDRMTPDKIRELAQKAALNDLTLERLSREMALLNSGKRDPIVLQAAKAWADEEISKTKIRT